MVLRLVLLATLLLVSPVWAVDYWVDPDTGVDFTNSGTHPDTAWATITHAETQTSSGDRIHLMAGSHSGTISGPNATVWMGNALDSTAAYGVGVALTSDSVTVKWIQASGSLGIYGNASNDSIAYCYTASGTVAIEEGDDNVIYNCQANTSSSVTTFNSELVPVPDDGDQGFRNTIRRCILSAKKMTWRGSQDAVFDSNRVELTLTAGVSDDDHFIASYVMRRLDFKDNYFFCRSEAAYTRRFIHFRDYSREWTAVRDTFIADPTSPGVVRGIWSTSGAAAGTIYGMTFDQCVILSQRESILYQNDVPRSVISNCVFVNTEGGRVLDFTVGAENDSLFMIHNTFISLGSPSRGVVTQDDGPTKRQRIRHNIFYSFENYIPSVGNGRGMGYFHGPAMNSTNTINWNLYYSEVGSPNWAVQFQGIGSAVGLGTDWNNSPSKPDSSSAWGNPRFSGINENSTAASIYADIQAGNNPFALLEGSAALAETENAPEWPDGYVGAIGYTTPATCSKRTGVDIYASPSGSGCDGESAANPIALETANAIAGPGCTVYLLGGDYEGSIYPLYSGTSDDPIVYMAAQDSAGEVPVVPRLFRSWTQVQHIKIARSYVRVRGIEARGGIYFSHYADTTSDGSSVRKAPTPYGSPDSVEVGAFQDSVSYCNAKYLVFSGADNCYAFQDSIDIGTESDLEAVRFTASDTTAKNTTDGAKASTRNTLAQSWVDADSLSNDETFFLVSNSLNDSLSRVVANFNFGAGDSFTVSNGLKIQRAKDLYVYDCRWNVEKYDRDTSGAKGYDTWALSIQDSVVDAVFRRDSIYANSLTSLNDDDDFRVWASLSTNEAAGQWYQASGSQQNTWRNCFYKLGGTIRATNMTQGTIDSSVFISRYGTALWMPGSSSGDIRYNTLIGRSRAMEFNSAGNTGWGPFDARIFYNIFYADDVTQSWKDTTFIGEVVVKIDTIWTGAPVYVGTGDNPKMNFNLFYGRKVDAYGNPQAPAVNPGTNSLTAQQHAMRYTAGGYPSNGSSLWGNPSFTDSLVPFASDVKWDSLGGTRDAVKPLGNTWAADTRWEQGYAGARVPNEAVGPSQITDLEMFVSFDEEPSLTLTWTATGDTIDGSQPAFIELAYSYSSPDSFLPTPVAPPITPANFTAYRTSVTRVPAMAAGETQFLAIPPIYIRQVGSNRYFIRVVDRFGNYGYSNRSVVWGN